MLDKWIAGISPKLIGGYFDTDQRAAGLGLYLQRWRIGRCTAPIIGVDRSTSGSGYGALVSPSFSLTFVVILLIGLDMPLAFSVGCARKRCVPKRRYRR